MKRYLTVKEVASELEYTERAIRNMIKQGSIPHIRLKKQRIRIPQKWLRDTLAIYPDEKAYKEAKEDIRFNADLHPKPMTKQIEVSTTGKILANNQAQIEKIKEVNEDMPKKQATQSGNTEITVSPAKANAFIPNPAKRNKKKTATRKARVVKTVKEVKEPETDEPENDDNFDDSFDSDMGNRSASSDSEDILSDYKGIGNWE